MSYRNPALITPASNQVFLDSINNASSSLKKEVEKRQEKKKKVKLNKLKMIDF